MITKHHDYKSQMISRAALLDSDVISAYVEGHGDKGLESCSANSPKMLQVMVWILRQCRQMDARMP